MSKFARKGKPPPGYDYLEPVLEALENELRDKVNEPHEGKRKVESLWPVHQINWQRTRYVYDMHYKYKKIDRKVWDYCCRNKIIDENLAKKWRKPGYERLCSTYVINTRNYNFGTVSICRVPPSSLGESAVVECPTTGCAGVLRPQMPLATSSATSTASTWRACRCDGRSGRSLRRESGKKKRRPSSGGRRGPASGRPTTGTRTGTRAAGRSGRVRSKLLLSRFEASRRVDRVRGAAAASQESRCVGDNTLDF